MNTETSTPEGTESAVTALPWLGQVQVTVVAHGADLSVTVGIMDPNHPQHRYPLIKVVDDWCRSTTSEVLAASRQAEWSLQPSPVNPDAYEVWVGAPNGSGQYYTLLRQVVSAERIRHITERYATAVELTGQRHEPELVDHPHRSAPAASEEVSA